MQRVTVFKKCIALLLTAVLLLSLSACASKKVTPKSSTASSSQLTLPFSSTDSIDPYACKSQTNFLLSGLIYESLYKLDKDRQPVGILAESVVTQDTTLTVTLREAKFSDGNAVTSDDVVHSFSRAKQSERFKYALTCFENAEKKGAGVVRFTLSGKNIYALNLLTFPIVEQKNNYIGSGLYKLSESNGEKFLEYNKYYKQAKPKIEKFALTECRDYTNAVNLFNDGKIDFLFDTLADGNIRSAAINSTKAKLNNFLFLGLNAKKGMCKNKAFRAALSLAINQTELCADALQGFAVPTATPFDADWSEIGTVVSNSVLSKSNEAGEAFAAAGCAYDKMQVNLMADDEQIVLTLLVNSANNMKIALANQIKTQLVNFGISVEIKKMPLDEYNIAIENENFDMYIGEVKIENDFNFDCFFTEDGGADFGISAKKLSQSYRLFKSGNATLQDFVSDFCALNPFIPIGYKCADVCFNASLKVNADISENDIYSGIEEWSK